MKENLVINSKKEKRGKMTNSRIVTEKDFRKDEFMDANPEDYEFRDDGQIVRKDRWEMGIRSIASILDMGRGDWEISDVVQRVDDFVNKPTGYHPQDTTATFSLPTEEDIKKLADGKRRILSSNIVERKKEIELVRSIFQDAVVESTNGFDGETLEPTTYYTIRVLHGGDND